MKKIVLFLYSFFLFFNSQGQDWNDSSVVVTMYQSDSIIQNLNKSLIPFGVLYDRVPPFSRLFDYGASDTGKNTSSLHFHQAYYEFYNCSYLQNNFLHPDTLISLLNENYSRNIHPISMLKANFSTIDTNAVANGSLTKNNGKLYDVLNQNPYIVHKSVLIALLNNGDDLDTGTHEFVFDKNFILGNDTIAIQSVSLDFHDGNGIQTRTLSNISPDNYGSITPFSLTVAQYGDLNIDENINLSDGSSYSMIFRITFSNKSSGNCDNCIVIGGCDGGDQLNIITSRNSTISDYGSLLPPRMSMTSGYQYPSPEGTAYIFYANANCASRQITKPIVFVDGYDPNNSRGVREIYSNYLNKEVTLPLPIGKIKIADYLRQIGYDIIILDYKNANDYIEENSMVVIKLLQTLWQQHSSTIQKNFVLIGPSLGALVSQYALAYMDHNSIPSHTRLFISFDGPHQGANANIGVQNLVHYILNGGGLSTLASGKIQDALYTFLDNAPARQILAHHYNAHSMIPSPDNFRNIFLNHLSSVNKYPTTCRNVAIIDGNKNGILNPYINACDRIVRLQYYYIGWIPIINLPTVRIIDWQANLAPTSGNCQNGHFFTFWPLLNLAGIPMGWTNTYSSPAPNNGSYDICPVVILMVSRINNKNHFNLN